LERSEEASGVARRRSVSERWQSIEVGQLFAHVRYTRLSHTRYFHIDVVEHGVHVAARPNKAVERGVQIATRPIHMCRAEASQLCEGLAKFVYR
jgi:hypothetical protein